MIDEDDILLDNFVEDEDQREISYQGNGKKMRPFLLLILTTILISCGGSIRDLQADEKIPISPSEMIKRIKDVPKILEWSKKKHLTISGPDFWGTHHMFI